MATRSLVPVLSSALALGVGVALGWALRGGSHSGERAAESPSLAPDLPPEDVVLLLKDLRVALQALTAATGRRTGELLSPAEDATRRRPAPDSGVEHDSSDLASALKDLAQVVAELRTSSGAPAARRPENLVKPAFVDREVAFAATGMERAAAAGEQALDAARAALNQSHMFLTSQEVLSRYGIPDTRYFQDSIEVWEYTLPREEGNIDFEFHFHEGSVCGCDFDR